MNEKSKRHLTDTNDPVCLVDHLFSQSSDSASQYEPVRRFGEDTFTTVIGGTVYEVSTHFNPSGKQSVMEQFKQLILSEHLLG